MFHQDLKIQKSNKSYAVIQYIVNDVGIICLATYFYPSIYISKEVQATSVLKPSLPIFIKYRTERYL